MSIKTPENDRYSNAAEYDSNGSDVYDLYASLLNYKRAINNINRIAVKLDWVPLDHRRRLKAYELLNSYFSNYSRSFRKNPETGDTALNEDLCEVGDSFWLCEKMRDKLLGGGITLNTELSSLGDKIAYEKLLQSTLLADDIKSLIQEQLNILSAAEEISLLREKILGGWFKNNNIFNTIHENELTASWSGDCVYYIYWDVNKECPNIKTYDPGFVFPFYFYDSPEESLMDGDKEIVERWFLAYDTKFGDYDAVYRETYELVIELDGYKCYKHAAFYKTNSISIEEFSDVNIFSDGLIDDWVDLQIDFIPFQWVSNLKIGSSNFGLSNIQNNVDILDNLINNYSDISTNSEYLGGAIIGASGKEVRPVKNSSTNELIPIRIMPRSVYFLGEGGSMDLIDTSNMQSALLSTEDSLFKRFLNNNNIPDILSSKGGDATRDLSGYALRIRMTPFIDKMVPLRTSRQEIYSAMMEKVMKMFSIYGNAFEKKIFSGALFKINFKFGDLYPQDEADNISILNSKTQLFSKKTVLKMAREAGYDIDIDNELDLLNSDADNDVSRSQSLFDTRLNTEEKLKDNTDEV